MDSNTLSQFEMKRDMMAESANYGGGRKKRSPFNELKSARTLEMLKARFEIAKEKNYLTQRQKEEIKKLIKERAKNE